MEKGKTVLGLDPGTTGAAVIINRDALHYRRFKTCTGWLSQLYAFLQLFPNLRAYMEDVHARRGDFGPQLAKFMRETGKVDGILELAGVSVEYVDPKTWQFEFGLGGKYGKEDADRSEVYRARKKAHVQRALQLFPDVPVTLDLADALLIAEYGRRKEHGELQYGRDGKEQRRGTGIRY
jgi:hypothetical protein